MKKRETRADLAGVRTRTLRRRTLRDLDKIGRLIEGLTAIWGEAEPGYAMDLEGVYSQVQVLKGEPLDQSIEHLDQPWDDLP